MKIIKTKFRSRCSETKELILKGDESLYDYSSKKIFSMNSKTAQRWKEEKFDIHYLSQNSQI